MSKTPPWLNKAKKHVWHPYTQEKIAPVPEVVVATKGCRLKLASGKEIIDGVSSWWSACHGYSHPYIAQQVKKQIDQMPHVMFAGIAHEQAYILCQRLANLTNMHKVFLSDSGSTGVETAMKMAIQYWHNKGEKKKNKFVSFKHGYHGDTMGCMSLSDPDGWVHKALNHYMPKQFCVKLPRGEYDFAEFDALLADVSYQVAGVIIEPLVQGAGGMKFHSADILAEIYRIAKKHNILFIADEVMTGFGRTGMMFASQEGGITPDIMCLGKALTAGFMTLSAVLSTEEVYQAFYDDQFDKALMSGPTFMANPLACAAANASLDLFEKEDILKKVEEIEIKLYKQLEPCRNLKKVKSVRVKGAIGVVQIETNWDEIFKLRKEFLKHDVWIRPFADVVYIMPPFNISDKELQKLTDSVCEVLSKKTYA